MFDGIAQNVASVFSDLNLTGLVPEYSTETKLEALRRVLKTADANVGEARLLEVTDDLLGHSSKSSMC